MFTTDSHNPYETHVKQPKARRLCTFYEVFVVLAAIVCPPAPENVGKPEVTSAVASLFGLKTKSPEQSSKPL